MQDTADRAPLQGGPDAAAGMGLGSTYFQHRPAISSAQPGAAFLAPQLDAASGAYSPNISAGSFDVGWQGQEVHTDVMPSEVLGWPPKQAVPAPSPSADSDIPGANGAADYKPAPRPDPYQVCLCQLMPDHSHKDPVKHDMSTSFGQPRF